MARETKIATTDMYGVGFRTCDGTIDHSRPRKRGPDTLRVRKGEEYYLWTDEVTGKQSFDSKSSHDDFMATESAVENAV